MGIRTRWKAYQAKRSLHKWQQRLVEVHTDIEDILSDVEGQLSRCHDVKGYIVWDRAAGDGSSLSVSGGLGAVGGGIIGDADGRASSSIGPKSGVGATDASTISAVTTTTAWSSTGTTTTSDRDPGSPMSVTTCTGPGDVARLNEAERRLRAARVKLDNARELALLLPYKIMDAEESYAIAYRRATGRWPLELLRNRLDARDALGGMIVRVKEERWHTDHVRQQESNLENSNHSQPSTTGQAAGLSLQEREAKSVSVSVVSL